MATTAMTEDRQPAVPGMKWQQTRVADGSRVIDWQSSPVYEVVPSCGNKEARGWWVCIEHGMAFSNNWEKDSHFTKKRKTPCHLAWFCAEHGVPEVP
jgi:hypothetical protein